MSIHEQIKQRRLALGMSQGDLAAKVSELQQLAKPLTWQTVQQWENGASAPKRTRLEFVARALRTTVQALEFSAPAVERHRVAEPQPVYDAGALGLLVETAATLTLQERQLLLEYARRLRNDTRSAESESTPKEPKE